MELNEERTMSGRYFSQFLVCFVRDQSLQLAVKKVCMHNRKQFKIV